MANPKLPLRLRSGKKVIHGGYSLMRSGELPQGPGMIEIERYLTYIREAYIGQLTNGGGEAALAPGQLILLNKLTTLEGCQRLVEVHAAQSHTIKLLDERYNARNNQIIKICLALGIEQKSHERVLTMAELTKKIEEEDQREEDES